MEGHTSLKTTRIIGTIQNTRLTILIDGGSTHNFIEDRLVKFMGLQTVHSNQFKVMVGNDEQLNCDQMYSSIPLVLNTTTFHIDFYILPISGADVVLGVPWLTILGPILTDYAKSTMSLHIMDNKYNYKVFPAIC